MSFEICDDSEWTLIHSLIQINTLGQILFGSLKQKDVELLDEVQTL